MTDIISNNRDHSKLKHLLKTKIKTTMIGALSAIEEHLGEILFSDPKTTAMYEKCRQDILDNGNEQIRGMEKELDLHNISRIMYTYRMQIKPITVNKEDTQRE
jgi:hypothetical protein